MVESDRVVDVNYLALVNIAWKTHLGRIWNALTLDMLPFSGVLFGHVHFVMRDCGEVQERVRINAARLALPLRLVFSPTTTLYVTLSEVQEWCMWLTHWVRRQCVKSRWFSIAPFLIPLHHQYWTLSGLGISQDIYINCNLRFLFTMRETRAASSAVKMLTM